MKPLWEPPVFERHVFAPKRTPCCIVVVVMNEGERLKGQLARMRERAPLADIVIADKRSTDGSTDEAFLRSMGVRALLVTDESGLSTATRAGIAFALEEGYEGVVTIDGNGKDGVEALPLFLEKLGQGYDLAQGSRFMKGGVHSNTPLLRYISIRFVAPPILWLGCRRWYTDPTIAFRAMSSRFLRDERVQPVRAVFVKFNLQHYFIYRAAKLGFRIAEIPVIRRYPAAGPVPTKVTVPGLFVFLWELVNTVAGVYDPR